MAAPTIRGQPTSGATPGGQQVQAQAHRRAYQRRKATAKAKSEGQRQKEAARVEALPVLRPHACGIDIGTQQVKIAPSCSAKTRLGGQPMTDFLPCAAPDATA